MLTEVALMGEVLSAVKAVKRPLSGVEALVHVESTVVSETPPTLRAVIGLLPCVNASVHL